MTASLSEVTSILREILQDSALEIELATRFDDLADWTSMDLVAAVVEAECRFNVHFDLPEIDRLVTVGDLMQMVAEKQALAAA